MNDQRIRFAARTGWNLQPNRLTSRVDQLRAAGRPIIDLTETNPTRCGFRYPGRQIRAALSRSDALVYRPHPRGAPDARAAVAAEYRRRGVEVSPEDLLLTASTSEAYGYLFRLLADPGDPVLVPTPCYPLFELLAHINDVRLVPYPLSADSGFALDVAALRSAAAGARALLLVNPGNPTGRFLRRRELEGIVDVCRQGGLPVVCDEVFGDYAIEEGPDRVASLAGHGGSLTFVLNGLSKMLALPQVKLAWIAVSGPAAEKAEALGRLEVIADTFLSVNTPVQSGLPDLLALRPSIQEQVMRRLRDNVGHLRAATAPPHPCRCLPCEGGWYAILEIPRTRSEEEWAIELLERDGVLAHPGYFFEFPDDGHLVVSLLPPPELFREGVGRLLRRLEASV